VGRRTPRGARRAASVESLDCGGRRDERTSRNGGPDHPVFEPPQGWLRAMLLFYDCVHSIVPPAAGYVMTPSTAALVECDPNAFVPLDPEPFTCPETWDEYGALLGVLRQLQPSGDRGAACEPNPTTPRSR
jgi:hypothetical protein